VFTEDTTSGNGTETSAYKLFFANGDAYYFSDTGSLLVQMDRFRNAINYYYGDYNGVRVLTKVVDSVGRAVDIQYNDTATIFKYGNRSVKLIKSPVPGISDKYYLSSFIDAQGKEFRYKYSFQDAAFDQVGGGAAAANNTYVNLVEIMYPTGAKTSYVWDKGKKNLGSSGYMEYYKVKERKDITGTRTYNLLKYQYNNEPDGYPLYKSDNIDELYKYSTVVIDSKGLKTKYMYNSKHLPYYKQQYSTRLLAESHTQFHTKYKLPIKVTSKSYNASGNVFEKVDLYDYDHRGNTIMENHPESPSQVNSEEHKVYYGYDYKFNLMTYKKFKQDKETSVEIRYTLNPDQKTVTGATTNGNGKVLTREEYTYDSYGNRISEKTEKEPGQWVTTKYEYGKAYKGAYLTAVTSEDVKDADGFASEIRVSYSYDFGTGNKLSSTDGKGNTIKYEYDVLDRLIKETNPDNSFRTYKYDDVNNILKVQNANGNKLTYYYDALGNLSKVIEPEKNNELVKMEYDENENLVSQTDGNKNPKKLAYDELTRLTGVTRLDSSGKVLEDTKVAYDEAFLEKSGKFFFQITVTQKGDRQDRVNNYYYDTYDRLAKIGRMNGGKEEFARYTFDYLGNQVETVDFAGQKSSAQYDALGRLVKEVDPENSVTKYKYDQLGNLLAVTNSVNQTSYFEYDSLGRKIIEKAPFEVGKYSVVKYYYDNNGNLKRTIDPDGFATKQYYDNRNFLTATERLINSNKSNITKYEHDNEGNTTRVIKGLNSFNDTDSVHYDYQYDDLNRLEMMTDALGKKTYYQYDNNGNLVKLTDRNKVETTYSCDGMNRLIYKKNSKDGEKNDVTITIDKLGQTTQMSDASGTTIFNYDQIGRLTTIDYGNGIRQKYDYDKADRISNMLVMQGSIKHINLNYEYDKTGRLTAVRDNGRKFGYQYNAIGLLMEETNGITGIKSEYQYYPSGNIKNLRHFSGNSLDSSYDYKYDLRGNQIQKDEGTGTTKYYYDALSRVKTVLMPNERVQNYEYDDLDNIKEIANIQGNKIEETSYLYDNDSRLLLQEIQKGTENIQSRFTYDDNGNQLTKDEVIKRNGSMVSNKSFNYWYDGFNQLTRVKDPDDKFVEYSYNGNGLRTKKDFGDKAINYYYDKGNSIVLETNQNNAATARNIRGLRLIYRENKPDQANSQFLYYLHNAHGDVTQLLNKKGQIIKDYRYDTFGQEEAPESKVFGGNQTTEIWRQEVDKIDNPFRYTGEYQDEETGNYYLRARYYDPSSQRFINEDSYGIEKGAEWKDHLYSYGNNNPIRYIDPTGHTIWDIVDVGFAALSWKDFKDKPTLSNFGWAVADTVALAPVVPSTGWARRGLKAGEKVGDAVSVGKKAGKAEEAATAGKYLTAIENSVESIQQQQLPDWLKATFVDGNYRTVKTTKDITLYRSFGGKAIDNPGAFATTNPASNRIQAKIDNALLPEWGNTRQFEAVIVVPKDTVLNIGKVASQQTKSGSKLKGGADQILLPQDWSKEWITNKREIPSR